METLQTVVNFVLNDLGAAVFVPLLMLIIGLAMKMKFSEAFVSALTLGIAFSGMNLLIGYMMGSMGD
ncbi:PTS transporter subunit IIC, partial [Vagococcus salmoninarum]